MADGMRDPFDRLREGNNAAREKRPLFRPLP